MNIDDFIELAEQRGNAPALIVENRPCSYSDFAAGVARWCSALGEHDLPVGAAVGMTGECSAEMIMLLFALMQRDLIAVPFLSANAYEVQTSMDTAGVAGRFEFDRGGKGVWIAHAQGASHPLVEQLGRDVQEPGLILFTSGSSGTSKAALHNVSAIWSRRVLSARPTGAALALLKLDHIGGINTVFHVLAGGGTTVFPPDHGVETICRVIQEHRIELLPTTPTFLNLLLMSGCWSTYDLSSLRLVTYGAEPMPPTTLQGMRKALPHVRFKQTYGLTETGILPTRSEDDGSTWLKVGGPGFETRIVDNILWIRAETSMLGYLDAPSPFDAEGWLNTGDLVEVRDGTIRILGRESEVINVGGEKVSPSEVEDIILQVDNVEDVVVRHRPNPVTGQMVIATVRLLHEEDHRTVAARVRRHCQTHLSPYKVPALVQITQSELNGRRFKKIRRPDHLVTSEIDFTSVDHA